MTAISDIRTVKSCFQALTGIFPLSGGLSETLTRNRHHKLWRSSRLLRNTGALRNLEKSEMLWKRNIRQGDFSNLTKRKDKAVTETVEYGELRSDGDFNNTKIGVTFVVRDGETYESALTRARQFVLEQMGDLKTIADLKKHVAHWEFVASLKKKELERMKAEVEGLKAIEDEIALLATAAQEAGLDVPEKLKLYDGIPF